jgi:hypothetical protein
MNREWKTRNETNDTEYDARNNLSTTLTKQLNDQAEMLMTRNYYSIEEVSSREADDVNS